MPATGSPPETPGIPPPAYLEVLARQRLFIVVFVASAVVTALAQTYVYSEKYESYTAISYRAQEVTRFKALQNEAMGYPVPQAPFKVIGQTLQEVLKSNAVLLDVVKALKLDERRAAYEGPWYRVWYERTKDWIREYGGYAWMLLKFGRIVEEDPTVAAINELRANIKVTNYDSYIFRLAVRDKHPERAAKIADRLGQVLAAWLLEFDRQPGRSRVEQLQTLLEEKKRLLAERRRDIESLLNENRVASVQLETEQLTENLSALRLEESRLASEIARAQARQASVEAKLSVKQRMLGAPEGQGKSAEYIQPEDFRKLSSQRLFDDLELGSLLAKQASLRSSIDAVNARLRKLPEVQARLDALKLSLASIERDFSLLNDSYQEAAVRATSAVSEVRVLHPAVVPTGPVSPIKVFHVLLAGGLGLVFAVGLVYLLEYLDIRILFSARREERAPEPALPVLPPTAGAPGPEGAPGARDG